MDRIKEWYVNLGRLGKIAVGVGIVFFAFIVLGAIVGDPEEQTDTQSSQTNNQQQEQPNQQQEQEQQEALAQAEEEAEQAREEAAIAKEEAADARAQAEEAEEAQAAAREEPPPPEEPAEDNAPPPEEEDSSGAIVRVTGGIPFSGSYGNIDTTQSVDGVAPAEYEVEVDTGFLAFDTVTAVMQKNGAGGELGVEIVVDGEVVKETSTSAEYGVAQVSWTPGE